ncbi:MAG: NAD+ synthase [Candidatus Omnitrophica bacterium]|nr:NAD+ synthase [Candidatus Omnitrophota bacterium]
MKGVLRIALAQINAMVGDIEANTRKILEYVERAKRAQADIVVFPELSLCGYPPEDLLLKPSFIAGNLKAIKRIATSISGIVAIVGFVDRVKKDIYNAAALISGGRIKGIYHKIHLSNYGVFDEKRYFKGGKVPFVFNIGGMRCGISIEDIWHKEGRVRLQAKKVFDIIFVINASPYYMERSKGREDIIKSQARKKRVFISYANLVGGQDELVFDGQSFVVDNKGMVIGRAEAFKEELLLVDIGKGPKSKTITIQTTKRERLHKLDEIYQALVLGLKDYVYKNGFTKVLIGISGGVDSALTAVIAKDALGKQNVIGVFMPSVFTSNESKIDAHELVNRLGISLYTIPITNIYNGYIETLAQIFKGCPKDITEENIQARIRGNLLMALSNKFGYLVLTTGNKSEISCGYCTLYGDMAGGFSVIKDVPKTLVYKLVKFVVNKKKEVIPRRIIARAPTAELRPDQKDTDTLPPYEILDPIIEDYIAKDKPIEAIAGKRDKKSLVLKVVRMIDKSEYKRRQAPPGIKITPTAFGKERRMPITNRFVEKI